MTTAVLVFNPSTAAFLDCLTGRRLKPVFTGALPGATSLLIDPTIAERRVDAAMRAAFGPLPSNRSQRRQEAHRNNQAFKANNSGSKF